MTLWHLRFHRLYRFLRLSLLDLTSSHSSFFLIARVLQNLIFLSDSVQIFLVHFAPIFIATRGMLINASICVLNIDLPEVAVLTSTLLFLYIFSPSDSFTDLCIAIGFPSHERCVRSKQVVVERTSLLRRFVVALTVQRFENSLFVTRCHRVIIAVIEESDSEGCRGVVHLEIVLFLLNAGQGPRPVLSLVLLLVRRIVEIRFAVPSTEDIQQLIYFSL